MIIIIDSNNALKEAQGTLHVELGEGGGAQREGILVIVMHILVHMHNEKLVCIPSCVHLLV